MPDFDFRVQSGTTTIAWDHEGLSHRAANVHRYRVVRPPTSGLAEIVIHCVVNGVVAPLDVALGGRLIVVSRLRWSGPFPFIVTQASGQSSVITLGFTAAMLGHQELVIRRPEGGSITLSFEVEPANA